jgi:hypothetical protein
MVNEQIYRVVSRHFRDKHWLSSQGTFPGRQDNYVHYVLRLEPDLAAARRPQDTKSKTVINKMLQPYVAILVLECSFPILTKKLQRFILLYTR